MAAAAWTRPDGRLSRNKKIRVPLEDCQDPHRVQPRSYDTDVSSPATCCGKAGPKRPLSFICVSLRLHRQNPTLWESSKGGLRRERSPPQEIRPQKPPSPRDQTSPDQPEIRREGEEENTCHASRGSQTPNTSDTHFEGEERRGGKT